MISSQWLPPTSESLSRQLEEHNFSSKIAKNLSLNTDDEEMINGETIIEMAHTTRRHISEEAKMTMMREEMRKMNDKMRQMDDEGRKMKAEMRKMEMEKAETRKMEMRREEMRREEESTIEAEKKEEIEETIV